MTDVGVTTARLSERVADEVRVALARKRKSAAALARDLGVSQTYVWRRLEGQTAFDLDDLEKIGHILDIQVVDLLRRAADAGINQHSSTVGRSDDPKRVRHLSPRPFGPSRRDRNRPVSAIPVTRWRPSPVRPGERAIAV